MVKRLFWLGLGLAAGAIVVRQLTKKAEKFTPGGIADSARKSAVGVVGSARSFVADVFENMHEREAEIHQAMAEGHLIDFSADEDDDDYPYDEREGGYRR